MCSYIKNNNIKEWKNHTRSKNFINFKDRDHEEDFIISFYWFLNISILLIVLMRIVGIIDYIFDWRLFVRNDQWQLENLFFPKMKEEMDMIKEKELWML